MNKTNGVWNLGFYIVTWNVSTKYPDHISLDHLLGIDESLNEQILPDFYIIGLQEVNANPQNMVTNLFKSDPWVQKIKELLMPFDYVTAKTEQMQGLLMVVFTKRKHLLHLRQVESEYTRTGFGGIWGNKGAVVIRMNIYGCTVCLVNSHLAAHDHMLDERVNDYQRIRDATKFSVKVSENIFEHDYVFWFGDLNFRLQGEEEPEVIREMVKRDKLQELMKKDQLMTVMCEGRAFSELVERPPQFPPTFKFEPGTCEYDMKRRPAWCDRILYKSKTKVLKNCTLELEQLSYKSHPLYNISDHKPVSSEFKIKVKEYYRYPKKIKTKKPLIKNLFPNATVGAVGASILGAFTLPIVKFSNQKPTTTQTKPGTETNVDEFYDAVDYSSDENDDDADTDADVPADQSPEDDITDKVIRFLPIPVWNNSEENVIEYILPPNYTDGSADWIGVFKEDFTGLEEYIGYEYTTTSGDKPKTSPRTVKLSFSDSINLPINGKFMLMYFQSTGTRGHTSMIGMSDTFNVVKRCPSPRPDTID